MTADASRNSIEIPGLGSVAPGSREAALLGPLLGMAVGDALGTTYEFARMDQPAYPTLATGPATDVVGGGPFTLTAGQITDDTQMAICLARSLCHARPLDLTDLGARYVAWFQHAFDVGNQTASALKAIETGSPAAEAGRQVWHASARRAAGNGSLMRTAPIGVAYAGAPLETIIRESLADSAVTHADPRCALACAVFNAGIAYGVSRTEPAHPEASLPARPASASPSSADDPIAAARDALTAARDAMAAARGAIAAARDARLVTGRAMLAAGREALPVAVAMLREQWSDNAEDLIAIERAEDDLRRDLETALGDTPGVHGADLDLQRTAGFVRVAFRLALWHLTHTPSWRDAVVDVASRGGDADTNAAIVGAIVGARDGVHAIPSAWLQRVLAAEQPGPAEWAAAHHPRHLVELARMLRA